jgi:uncharacterized protein (DUF2235 family)
MALYAFDGTWNKERDAGEYGKNTNVVRFKELYTGPKFFYKGVGTKHGNLGKLFGGAFGVGGHERIEDATKNLSEQLASGDDTVDIIGFSRGAALAMHFANVVAAGVRVTRQGRVETARPAIRFLGVWDIVAAFGIPIDVGIRFSRINLGYKLSLPGSVQHCFHALALDERRQAFRPTRVPSGYEVWFRGVHSDVGGGNENPSLNDIALRWMLNKALAVGLPLAPDCIGTACTRADPKAKIGDNLDPIANSPRSVGSADRIHYSVSERAGHVNPPAACPRETEASERQAVAVT